MFCRKCGKELRAGAKFCGKCGHPVPPAPVKAASPKVESPKAEPLPVAPPPVKKPVVSSASKTEVPPVDLKKSEEVFMERRKPGKDALISTMPKERDTAPAEGEDWFSNEGDL